MSVVDRHGRRAEPPPARLQLTDAEVKAIRRELMVRLNAMGHSLGVVAKVLNAPRSTVAHVLAGRRRARGET